jgi:hypothetical protein
VKPLKGFTLPTVNRPGRGSLRGYKATSHWSQLESLRAYGAEPMTHARRGRGGGRFQSGRAKLD